MGQIEMLAREEMHPRKPETTPDFLREVHNPSPRPEPAPDPKIVSNHILEASLGIFHAIGLIVAVRLLLLLAMAGGFSLAVMAMQDSSHYGLFVFIAYSVLAVLPIVWLDRSERKKS